MVIENDREKEEKGSPQKVTNETTRVGTDTEIRGGDGKKIEPPRADRLRDGRR